MWWRYRYVGEQLFGQPFYWFILHYDLLVFYKSCDYYKLNKSCINPLKLQHYEQKFKKWARKCENGATSALYFS